MRKFLLAILLVVFAVPLHAGQQMHPAFYMLDSEGVDTFGTNRRPNADVTCGVCHDTEFVQSHSLHWDRGMRADCFFCHLDRDPLALAQEDYTADGTVRNIVSTPASETCGRCHGITHTQKTPLDIAETYERWMAYGRSGNSLKTGTIYSGQRLSESFLNLENKASLGNTWDVHAASLLKCTSCHFAPNKPGSEMARGVSRPAHLINDPRQVDIGEYLKKPDHRLAVASCGFCHDTEAAHQKLPYAERHEAVLDCQACHVPRLMAPALLHIPLSNRRQGQEKAASHWRYSALF